MRKRIILVILLSSLINIHPVNASDEIALKSRRFTPSDGITAATKEKIEAIPGRAHVLIQLENIPTIKEKKELEAKGIRLLSYVPNKAWFASIDSDKTGEIAALSSVRAISEILPEDKIDPSIKEKGVNNYSTSEKGEAKLVVVFFDDVSLNEASSLVLNYKGTIIGEAPTINALVVYLPKNLIYELAGHDSVKWIDQHYEPAIANDGSRAAIGVNAVQAPPYNLTGTGVIAGNLCHR